jgi:hypothetical protein
MFAMVKELVYAMDHQQHLLLDVRLIQVVNANKLIK